MVRIGVSAIGYECAEHLESVLKPWMAIKQDFHVDISISHGVFPETASLGFPVYSTDETIDRLLALKGADTNVIITDSPTLEKDLRNITLPFLLDRQPDLVWLLDLQDELYTERELRDIIKFIYSNENIPWFQINFKNYVFNRETYVNDFVVPRIWRNQNACHCGFGGFVYDNEVVFADGSLQNALPSLVVPRDIAFPRHFSWIGSKEYLLRKINFQRVHYGDCSYEWNEQTNQLDFNYDYYRKFNKALPTLFKDL